MSPARRILVACVVMMLAAPLASGAEPPPTGLLIVGLRASGEISGPVLASGRLLDAAGHPISGRAVAVAWPTAATLAALADGDPVFTLPVAQVLTGRDGRFDLRVDPRIDLSEYTEADGTINFDLRAAGDAGAGLVGFSRRLSRGGPPAWADAARSDDVAAADLTVPLDGPADVSAQAVDSGAENKTGTCPDYIVATYNYVHVDIGESYSGPTNQAQFAYEASQSSTLGIGVSASGVFGSFSVSGSTVSTNTAGNTFGRTATNTRRLYQTGWQYRKIDIWQGYYTCSHWRYEVRPTVWQMDFWEATPSSTPTALTCSNVPPGSTPYKVSGTARTLTAGAKLSGVIGNNLSSQTGFSTKTTYTFPFNSSGGRLCGNGVAWGTAPYVVGKGP